MCGLPAQPDRAGRPFAFFGTAILKLVVGQGCAILGNHQRVCRKPPVGTSHEARGHDVSVVVVACDCSGLVDSYRHRIDLSILTVASLAAIAILLQSIRKWIAGLQLEHLGTGALLVLIAGILNAGLGYYLLRTGRRTHSLILEADGKHVLTDSWTSFGVVGGLALVLLTGWKPFDPLVAIVVAANILWSGGRLVWRSAVGLLDYSDPKTGHRIRDRLDAISSELGIEYHGVRFGLRDTAKL
jgi:Cation efflux family